MSAKISTNLITHSIILLILCLLSTFVVADFGNKNRIRTKNIALSISASGEYATVVQTPRYSLDYEKDIVVAEK